MPSTGVLIEYFKKANQPNFYYSNNNDLSHLLSSLSANQIA